MFLNKICSTCKYYTDCVKDDETESSYIHSPTNTKQYCKLMVKTVSNSEDQMTISPRVLSEYPDALNIPSNFSCIHWKMDKVFLYPNPTKMNGDVIK